MTGPIDPASRVDDDLVVPDDGPDLDPPPRFIPRTVDECAGPGPLLREYRRTEYAISVEQLEPCPTCNDTLQHRFRRVIGLEEQDQADQWRQPGEMREAC